MRDYLEKNVAVKAAALQKAKNEKKQSEIDLKVQAARDAKAAAEAEAAAKVKAAAEAKAARLKEQEKEQDDRLKAALLEANKQTAAMQIAPRLKATAAASMVRQSMEEDQVFAQDPGFEGFRREIEVRCNRRGLSLFHDIFKCSLPRLFKTLMAVRNMSDDAIIELLTLMTPTKSSQRRLSDYIDLNSSRHNCRAFFVFALLNTLCREEEIRFVFIGRTFLQLLSCFSDVSIKELQELHIPKKVSDIDVYAVLRSIPPLECRELLLFVFTSSIDALSEVHYQRDGPSWAAFKKGQVGNLYVAPSRVGNVMKVSKLLSDKVITEVSDIGVDSVESFARRFPELQGRRIVQELPLLGLDYVLTPGALSTSQVVELQFAFPGADSGVLECLRNVLNILRDFVTNSLQEKYFIMTSNLLKFVVRAIQYEHIRVIQLDQHGRLKEDSTPKIYSLLIQELDTVIDGDDLFQGISESVRKRIREAGKELIKLFFSKSTQSLDDSMFELAELYKQTAIHESYKRITGKNVFPMHKIMLALYTKHGFDYSKLQVALQLSLIHI